MLKNTCIFQKIVNNKSMKRLFFVFVFLILSTAASNAENVMYYHSGNMTYDSNGNSYLHSGNMTYDSNGNSYYHSGNMTYDSNGNSYYHDGNMTYDSNGNTYYNLGY